MNEEIEFLRFEKREGRAVAIFRYIAPFRCLDPDWFNQLNRGNMDRVGVDVVFDKADLTRLVDHLKDAGRPHKYTEQVLLEWPE